MILMYALTLRQGKSVFVGKRFIYELVIDVYHTRAVFVTFVVLIDCCIFDQVKAHLTGKLCCSCIAFQTADKLCMSLSSSARRLPTVFIRLVSEML